MKRLERWVIIGDGLIYCEMTVPNDDPPSVAEVLHCGNSDHAVITIFDALTNDLIGMAYAAHDRPELEIVKYGRRHDDPNPYTFRAS
jgi:hypothetical protein